LDYDKILEEAERKRIEKSKKWSKAKIIEKIQELYKKGDDLSHEKIKSNNSALVSAARRHFGSWENAIQSA